MQTKLNNLIIQFEALVLRLRILLTLCVIAIIFMIFDISLFSANNKIIENLQQENITSKNQTVEFLDLQNKYNKKTFFNRSDPKNDQLKKLNAAISIIHKQLTEHTANLIHPQDMPKVLKTILSSTQKLQLQSLIKQETTDLSETEKDKDNRNQDRISLYRHSVEILLYGDYQSTLKFLQTLEDMEKKVAFDSLEYVVDTYPKANIKLTISTLSLQYGWIGG